MSYLFDTNVISELSRREPNPGAADWATRVAVHLASAISVDEIRFGIARTGSLRLKAWADEYFARHQVLPVTPDIAQRAGEMRGRFARAGISRQQADMLIAATAQAHGLTLVTRNTKDFEGCGIALLNPFTE